MVNKTSYDDFVGFCFVPVFVINWIVSFHWLCFTFDIFKYFCSLLMVYALIWAIVWERGSSKTKEIVKTVGLILLSESLMRIH